MSIFAPFPCRGVSRSVHDGHLVVGQPRGRGDACSGPPPPKPTFPRPGLAPVSGPRLTNLERSQWRERILQSPQSYVAQELVAGRGTKLLEPIPHGTGQTIAREAMLLADHNAYHVAQLILVRRLPGAWKD